MVLKRKLTRIELDELSRLLKEEGIVDIDTDILRKFLSHGQIVKMKAGDVLGDINRLDINHYVVFKGILRKWFWEKDTEKTSAFALPGTIFVDYHSYFKGVPAFYIYEACCDTRVIRIDDQVYEEYINAYPEFVRWILSVTQGQLYCYEKMDAEINGSVIDRYRALVDKRPEIIRNVSVKNIASYLGITPQYLSMIRRQLRDNQS